MVFATHTYRIDTQTNLCYIYKAGQILNIHMKNDKVLITGAGGFIGSHITELFVDMGYQVKAFIHYNSQNSYGWLDHSRCVMDIEIVTGDIRDYDSVFGAMKGCKSVIHLAALIGIPYSIVTPKAYLETNINGTYNVLYAALQQKVSSVVITSTSEIFGTAQTIPMSEHHPVSTRSPYAASKIAADHLAMSFYYSYGLPVKIIRPFNAYGPRQSARAIIPAIIIQALNQQKIIRIGNDYPTRDFTYVTDLAEAYEKVASSVAFIGESVNVGTNSEISVLSLANKIISHINPSASIEVDTDRTRSNHMEVKQLRCDNTKMMEKTNWKQKHSIEEGLENTIDWLKKHHHLYKSNLYNI